MTTRPRVSVLVINYNYGRYLPRAIESVLAQDLEPADLEVIVVDDGSTDDSAERVRPYLGRVRWLTQPNGGQVSAFNAGFREARGEYVALLESDDWWEKGKLSKALAGLEKDPEAALIQHWMLQVDADGRRLPGYSYPPGPTRFSLEDTLEGRIPTAGTSCIVFRAERLRPFLPLPSRFQYGADICLRLLAATMGPIANIPEVLGCRRIHGGNLFGETIYDSPRKLAQALPFHTALIDYQRAQVERIGRALDPVFVRRLEGDRLQMELFLHRYNGDYPRAAGAWLALLRHSGARLYTVFKVLSLLIALVSPAWYLAAHRLYARGSSLRRLRRTFFPE